MVIIKYYPWKFNLGNPQRQPKSFVFLIPSAFLSQLFRPQRYFSPLRSFKYYLEKVSYGFILQLQSDLTSDWNNKWKMYKNILVHLTGNFISANLHWKGLWEDRKCHLWEAFPVQISLNWIQIGLGIGCSNSFCVSWISVGKLPKGFAHTVYCLEI